MSYETLVELPYPEQKIFKKSEDDTNKHFVVVELSKQNCKVRIQKIHMVQLS